MRKATLRTYTKNKLVEYYEKPLYFSNMLLESSSDQRLAEAAQAYYLAKKDFSKANAFSFKTKETYNSYDEFVSSNQKYAWQFRELNNRKNSFKEKSSSKLLDALKDAGKTKYWLAKMAGTCQSNVDQFLSKKNLNALSNEKVLKLLKLLEVDL